MVRIGPVVLETLPHATGTLCDVSVTLHVDRGHAHSLGSFEVMVRSRRFERTRGLTSATTGLMVFGQARAPTSAHSITAARRSGRRCARDPGRTREHPGAMARQN